MRLIDADAITQAKFKSTPNEYALGWNDAIDAISENAPTEEGERAIEELDKALNECINELCLYCGKYKMEHMGACSGCKWYVMKQI